jgi:hypothetical protein
MQCLEASEKRMFRALTLEGEKGKPGVYFPVVSENSDESRQPTMAKRIVVYGVAALLVGGMFAALYFATSIGDGFCNGDGNPQCGQVPTSYVPTDTHRNSAAK